MSGSSSAVTVAREWYDIVTQYSYDPATPYRAGQHRGVIANVRGGDVRSLVDGRVVFSGRVVNQNVVVVLARDARGRAIRSTYVGLDNASAHVGQVVQRGDLIGNVTAGHTLKLGLRDALDRSQYLELRAATLTRETLAPVRAVPKHVTSPQSTSGSDSIGEAVVRQLTHLVMNDGSGVGQVSLTQPSSLHPAQATSIELNRISLGAAQGIAIRQSTVSLAGPPVNPTTRIPTSSATFTLSRVATSSAKLPLPAGHRPVSANAPMSQRASQRAGERKSDKSRTSESLGRSAQQTVGGFGKDQRSSFPAQAAFSGTAAMSPHTISAVTSAQLPRSAQELFGGFPSTSSSSQAAPAPTATSGSAPGDLLGHWFPWLALIALISLLTYRRRQRRQGVSCKRVPVRRELAGPVDVGSEFELAAEQILRAARSRDVSRVDK
ncbi:MAG: peptidoglycan DD-metalloendopeptidase family protein [Thermoleophilia bacterium]|nr:peptidoglycan DD-metalloendopeptidase family protein [Thermoleophilia bacterium]